MEDTSMITTLTLDPVTAPAEPAATVDPFCQHEFDDGGLCGHDALPGSTRCAGHQGDGQPDFPLDTGVRGEEGGR
jgi:hypothetical protein